MKYTHVIWDFNGTIFDDVDACIKSINVLLEKRGLETVPDVCAYREVFDFPIQKYYIKVGFDFEIEPFTSVAEEWMDLYLEFSKNSTACEGAVDTLLEISELQVKQLVLSASEVNMLSEQLDDLKVKHYFCEILGLDNILAGGKTAIGRSWREKNPCAVALFIGDTIHDAEVARAIGADCVLYAGGHQSKTRLEETGYPVVEKIKDILQYLK